MPSNNLIRITVKYYRWVLFEHKDYKGNIYVAVEGDEFKSVDWNDKASSIKLIENVSYFFIVFIIVHAKQILGL